MNTNDFRGECAALAALLDRMSPAPVRPAGYPERLDAAQPGDVLVMIDAGQTPALRRLVTVTARDERSIEAAGERYHAGHGFALAGIEAGNLTHFVQPVDDWSFPGWSGALGLEV